jgi:hypothetical protein
MNAKSTYQAPTLRAMDDLVPATRAQQIGVDEPTFPNQKQMAVGSIGFGL